MSEIIVLDGDTLQFDPMFGHRQVTVTGPALIRASGHATVENRRTCVLGDEKQVRVPAIYQIPGYSPGEGFLTIEALSGNQQAPRVVSGDAALLLKGQRFLARFTPARPAMTASVPVTPDSGSPTFGYGAFVTRQVLARAG